MLKSIKNWLLPSACVLCSKSTHRDLDICIICENNLPWLMQHSLTANLVALFSYQKPVDQLITRLKFQKNLVYARLLGELFIQHILNNNRLLTQPEIIIPIPLHPKRLSERGFNQALEIVRPIAKKLKVPIDIKSCQRIRATHAQSDLPANQRAQNIKNAFQVSKNLNAKHVVIFDDVVTTGHTVDELSKILKTQGVERVDVWCCAKTTMNI